jgi:nucleoid-associated protein YgaU
LIKKFPCLQELPPTEPADQGGEGEWDTVGEATGSRSPAPIVEEILVQMERQPPTPQGRAEPTVAAAEEVIAAEAQESAAPAAVTAEGAATAEAQEEVPAEAGLVDIASILGGPTVTVIQSNL